MDSVLLFARKTIKEHVKQGDVVVDATVGQGNDTSFLALLTGDGGNVFGFDVQPEALELAQNKCKENQLASEALSGTIHWILRSHEFMCEEIPLKWHGRISAAMFNLGYLPGSNHNIITHATSTVKGLESAVQLLRSNGVVTVIVYTGHIGAQEEANAVIHWAAALSQNKYHVLHYHFLNQIHHPPFLIVVEKK